MNSSHMRNRGAQIEKSGTSLTLLQNLGVASSPF